MNIYHSDSGNTVQLGKELGKGGEGAVYSIQGDPSNVLKIYIKQQPAEIYRKLLAMVKNPPHDPTVNGPTKHRSIAWPSDILYSDRQKTQFAGYIMPYVEPRRFSKMLGYIDPDSRKKSFMGGFTWLHLYSVACNLASCVAAIHERGYCIGDINESNILVDSGAPLTIIDCDSFQVKDPSTGQTWRCTVGKPEYTAPELMGYKYENVDRTFETDSFALAIMIFQLLMEGYHPYAARGSLVANASNTPDKIKLGIFPYGTSRRGIEPPDGAPPFDLLHPSIQSLFIRCFDSGHKNPSIRPSAKEWMKELRDTLRLFTKCNSNENHRYLNHLKSCPWCDRAHNLGNDKDSFPSSAGVQIHIQDPNSQMVSRQDREAYLLRIITFALMDGCLSPEEEAYIISEGSKVNISEKDVKQLIAAEVKKKGLLPGAVGSPSLRVDRTYIALQNVKIGLIRYEMIEVSNVGNGVLTGTITSNVPWIKVPVTMAPNIQNQSQKIQLTIDTSSLPYGFSGTGTVSIKTNGGDIGISVSLATEGLSNLVSKFRLAHVPFIAACAGFIGSFSNSPVSNFFSGVFIAGIVAYVFAGLIVKHLLNKGIDIFKYPKTLIQVAAGGVVILTIMSHSGGSSGVKQTSSTPAKLAPIVARIPEPAPKPTAVKSQVVINRSGVAEEVNNLGAPIGVNTVFHGNAFDGTRRQGIAYFAEFSGAIPKSTHFEVRLFRNDASQLGATGCRTLDNADIQATGRDNEGVAKKQSGIFSCRTWGYYLLTGNWEVRLFVTGQEIQRTQFEIVPGQNGKADNELPITVRAQAPAPAPVEAYVPAPNPKPATALEIKGSNDVAPEAKEMFEIAKPYHTIINSDTANDRKAIAEVYLTRPYEYECHMPTVNSQVNSFNGFIRQYPNSIYVPEALLNVAKLEIYSLQCPITPNEKLMRIDMLKKCYLKIFAEYKKYEWSKHAKDIHDFVLSNERQLAQNKINDHAYKEIEKKTAELFEKIPLCTKPFAKDVATQNRKADNEPLITVRSPAPLPAAIQAPAPIEAPAPAQATKKRTSDTKQLRTRDIVQRRSESDTFQASNQPNTNPYSSQGTGLVNEQPGKKSFAPPSCSLRND